MCNENEITTKQLFSFGELWTGGAGGWPCDFKDDKGKRCGIISNVIQLSKEEVEQVAKSVPESFEDGRLGGGSAAGYIIRYNLGKVLCEKHITIKP